MGFDKGVWSIFETRSIYWEVHGISSSSNNLWISVKCFESRSQLLSSVYSTKWKCWCKYKFENRIEGNLI